VNKEKIKIIYDSLIDVQEKLLSLPDDIHLDIGVKFLRNYNNNLTDFTKATNKISENLRSYFKINPEDENIEEETSNGDRKKKLFKNWIKLNHIPLMRILLTKDLMVLF